MVGKGKILVVDDSPETLFATSRVARQAGYQVIEARTGEQCMAQVRRHAPDMVLLDVVLPDADGMELAQNIKADPATRHTFVILLSAKRTSAEDRTHGLHMGADGYIARPVSNQELAARIDALCRIKNVEKVVRAGPEKLRITLESIGDAVITTDQHGNIDVLNPVAEKLSGWRQQEAQGRPFEEVFPLVEERTRHKRENIVRKVLREGTVVELDKPTVLLARDGTEVPIADSGAPIRNDSGMVTGTVVVLQDATQDRQREIALEKSREDEELVFEAIGHPTWIMTPDRTILRINQSAASMVQTSADELMGRKCYEVFHQGQSPAEGCPVEALLRSGAMERFDMEMEAMGRTFLVSCTPVLGKSGQIEKIIHIATDITERKRAEEALRQSEAKYRRLHESMMDAFVAVDMQGRIREFNPAYREMLGYSEEELRRLSYRDLTPEKWHALELQIVTQQILRKGYSDVYEKEYRRRDGTVFPVELRTFLVCDEAGEPAGMWAIVRDISQRKQGEEALRESQRQLATLLSNLPGMAYRCSNDPDWTMDFVSDGCLALTGYRPEDLIGNASIAYSALIHPQDRQIVWDEVQVALANKQPFQLIYRIAAADGQVKWVWEQGQGVFGTDGDLVALEGFIIDISERKRAEEEQEKLRAQLFQAQKMESVGRLAGGVAHDFNNMLGVILGFSELVMNRLDRSDPIFHKIEEIHKAAQRSANLTRQLLAFARKQTISPRVLDLNETIEGMLKMLRRLIGEDIHVVWLPCEGLWPVHMDPSQIDQILANLCVNARDAIAGVGKIVLETKNLLLTQEFSREHAGVAAGEYVTLTVSDSGCGMDRETLTRLFEPFFTTKEVGKGTGLGLATVYGIVKQNNGFINVLSQPDEGTTFTIYLPRHRSKAEQMLKETAADAEKGGETILLVEDEAPMLKVIRIMLENMGYRVLAAATPGAGMEIAREHPGEIQLLITDVIMPEMNGRDLAKRLLSLYPAMKTLFMSGYTADFIVHHGVLDEGMHFMQKPFTAGQLASKVAQVLGRGERKPPESTTPAE